MGIHLYGFTTTFWHESCMFVFTPKVSIVIIRHYGSILGLGVRVAFTTTNALFVFAHKVTIIRHYGRIVGLGLGLSLCLGLGFGLG